MGVAGVEKNVCRRHDRCPRSSAFMGSGGTSRGAFLRQGGRIVGFAVARNATTSSNDSKGWTRHVGRVDPVPFPRHCRRASRV